MIQSDSILRRLPSNLDRRQALFLDGIRHAAEIVSFAYTRLQTTLTHIATTESLPSSHAQPLYTSAFLDAWSVVDAIDRFRAIWALMPERFGSAGVSKGPTFAELSQSVRDLRNVADHLAQRLDYIVAHKGAALGTLSWFTMTDPAKRAGLMCALTPGTIQSQSGFMVNPVGQLMELPTGLIHLAAGEHRANLSNIIPEMVCRVHELEAQLAKKIAALDAQPNNAAADVLVKMMVVFDSPIKEELNKAPEQTPGGG